MRVQLRVAAGRHGCVKTQTRAVLSIACIAFLAACGSRVEKAEVRAGSSPTSENVLPSVTTLVPKSKLPSPTVTTLVPPSNPVQMCENFGLDHHLEFVPSAMDPALGGPIRLYLAKLRAGNLGVGPWGDVSPEDWVYICPFHRTAGSEPVAVGGCRGGPDVVDVWIDGAGRSSPNLFQPAC